MDKQNLMPHQAQPISRITTGQLPAELAELSEEVLAFNSTCVLPSGRNPGEDWEYLEMLYPGEADDIRNCSYEGNDAE